MSQRCEEGSWPAPAVTVAVTGTVAFYRRGGSSPKGTSRGCGPFLLTGGLGGYRRAGARQRGRAVHRLPWRKAEPRGDGCAAAVRGASVWKRERLPSPSVWVN